MQEGSISKHLEDIAKKLDTRNVQESDFQVLIKSAQDSSDKLTKTLLIVTFLQLVITFIELAC